MKVLVVGASGLLGHTLFRRWSARKDWVCSGTSHSQAISGLRRLDLMKPSELEAALSEFKPDVVVFPASNPHVDDCERRPAETRLLNVDATLAAARAVFRTRARFVFFSTDFVFDGTKPPYKETDAPNPLGEYARQKLTVERELAAFGKQALVLRVSGLFGWTFKPTHFVHQVVSRLAAGQEARAAVDQSYNPTFVEYLAEAVAVLIEKDAAGLFHLAGSERLTRIEFARAAAEAFGFDPARVAGVPAKSLTPPGAAARPAHSSLDSAKAAALLGAALPGARAGLARMAAEAEDWKKYSAGLPSGRGV